MRGAHRPRGVRREHEALEPRLGGEVERDRPLVDASRRAVRRRAEGHQRVPREEHEVAGPAGRRRDVPRDVGEPADRADGRRRPDVDAARRVVQGHVAGDDRHAERVARGADAVHGLLEVVCAARALGVAEVEAVGDRERGRADADQVARRLRDRQRRARERVDRRDARLRVDRDRPLMRSTAASAPGPRTVSVPTIESKLR